MAYFVSAKDGSKHILLLGPFTSETACKEYSEFKEDNPNSKLSDVIDACCKIDRKAHFFSYGMAEIRNFVDGSYIPALNRVDPDTWNGVLK